MASTQALPTHSSNAAAMAGPMKRAALNVAELSAIADGMSSLVTRPWTIAMRAGVVSDSSEPIRSANISTSSMVTMSASASPAKTMAARNVTACAQTVMRR